VYFTLFLYGYWMGEDEGFWAEAARLRWRSLGLALGVMAAGIALLAAGSGQAASGRQLMRLLGDVYMWSAVLAILGWAHWRLNRPWRWLAWANESVYPWYMLHQTLIIVLVVWLAPLRLAPGLEGALLVLGTVVGCWAITSVVRRTGWLRPLFGLKRPAPSRYPSPSRTERPAANSA